MLFKPKKTHEKPTSVTRIFLIILFAIIVDQSLDSVLLESIVPIDPTGLISNIFLSVCIPCALFLASLSDFHCRRRILLFALASLLLSGTLISYFNAFGGNWIAYTALACKGIGGNVTPIALASLATIVSPKKFTISLAVAICAYSLGSWVPIYLRSFEDLALSATALTLACILIAVKWFKETEFDDFKLKNNNLNLKHFFTFAWKDWKLIALFCALTPVILVISGFVFSEISFYQILLRGEVLNVNEFYSNISLKFGLSYYVGTGILCILKSKNVPDIKCLKLGITIALLSIITASILAYIPVADLFSQNLMLCTTSIGFSLLTPSLFSMLSKIRKLDEQGKIYGLLDSTDTLSILVVTKYIKSSKSVTYNHILWISSTILLISGIFILSFIYYIKNLRYRNEHPASRKKGPR